MDWGVLLIERVRVRSSWWWIFQKLVRSREGGEGKKIRKMWMGGWRNEWNSYAMILNQFFWI